jgi:hypothetical protein
MQRKVIALALLASLSLAVAAGCGKKQGDVVNPTVKGEVPKDSQVLPVQPSGGGGGPAKMKMGAGAQ